MKAAAWAVVLALVLVGIAGCVADPNRTAPGRDLRGQWERERDSASPLGRAASFDVSGSPLVFLGEGASAQVTAPFSVSVADLFPARDPYLFFVDADVDSVGRGLVAVEGGRVRVESGSAGTVGVRSATVTGDAVDVSPQVASAGLRPNVSWPESWNDANRSIFFAQAPSLSVDGWAVSGHQRAVLLTPTGAVDLPSTFTVDAARLLWAEESQLRAVALSVSADRFSLAGNVTGGSIQVEGEADTPRPKGIFGLDARLRLEPARAATDGSFQATQVLTNDGLLFRAKVEVVPNKDVVAVEQGKDAWLSLSHREASYRADASLRDVRITGPGADLVEVPIERAPWLVEELLALLREVAEDQPWMAPFLAIPLLIAAPFVAMVDLIIAVACAFTTCPEKYPYPIWMDAGHVGVSFLKAKGDAAPGDYPVTVTLEGENFDDATFTFTLRVVGPT